MAPIHDAKAAPRNKRPSTLRILLFVVALVVVTVQVAVLPMLYYKHHDAPVRAPDSLQPGNPKPRVDREVDAEPPVKANKAKDDSPPDGTFNGVNVYYRDATSSSVPLHSTVHCVGEAFTDRHPWTHRSCDFRNLCFDVGAREFVLFRSDAERRLQSALNGTSLGQRGFVSVSSSMDTTVSIGGLNPVWGWDHKEGLDMKSLEWFPRVVEHELSGGYYELSTEAVLVPFHSMAAHNVGHLVWDDFLPIYTLLSMFNMLDDGGSAVLALMRVLIKDENTGKGLWATCEWRDTLATKCRALLTKFLPLLGVVEPNVLGTTEKFDLSVSERRQPRRSKYVCAKRGVAGMGMLTDHGLKKHGWDKPDYEYSHNVGRGPMLYEFRNYMMRNLGLEPEPSSTALSEPPYKVVFSRFSSSTRPRSRSFDREINAVKAAFANNTDVIVEAYQFSRLSVKEQVKITSEAAVYITACGGGAVTSMFLPRGAGLILYHDEYGRDKKRQSTETPARLDWDYLNNASYLRAHWLPLGTIGEEEDLDLLVGIVRNELEVVSHS